ncbi:coenzyme F420-0:L-glutamate ligase [Pyrofollis japonicus]|nr:coenzyme F420-0:L-glutamate ligase [Pyrofollis japonicus]
MGVTVARRFEVIGLSLPEARPGTDLAKLIVDTAAKEGIGIHDRDVIVAASKLVMKARRHLIDLRTVKPSFAARLMSLVTGKDSVEVELVLRASKDFIAFIDVRALGEKLRRLSPSPEEADKLINTISSIMFVVTRQGLIAMDGGVDYSNVPPGYAVANIVNFDEEARRLRNEIEQLTGKRVAVVITDTETNTSGKVGTVDVAVGSSGIEPVRHGFASRDIYGRPKFGGVDIIVDEVASAAALLMGQTSEGIPVVIVRGLEYRESAEGVSDYALGFKGLGLRGLIKNLFARIIYRLFWRPSDS